MASSQLPIWKTLGAALDAPLSLASASWKALAGPLLALTGASVLAFLVGYWKWGVAGWVLTALLVLAAAAWLALEFQRHLLLGAAACESQAQPWRRYGLYLLAIAIVFLLLSVLSGLMMNLAYPAMGWFQTALNGSDSLFVAGWVVLGVLVLGVAAYPSTRLALILPALAIGHDTSLARTWRLSRGNGLRLLTLLLVIPGFVQGLVELVQPNTGSAGADIIAGVLLNTYLTLVQLALLAYAYRALSDQTLPLRSRDRTVAPFTLSPRLVGTLALVALVGLVGAALWDALYRIEPGETILIVRLGKPERIESVDGLRLKIPLIEEARPMSKTASYRSEGDGYFLTVSKESLSLKYRTRWRVTNAEIYFQATGGEVSLANARIGDLAAGLLRARIAKLSSEEVRRLLDAGGTELGVDDGSLSDPLLGDVLEQANDKTRDLGIEITSWRVEVTEV